jgi:hypothetical protein
MDRQKNQSPALPAPDILDRIDVHLVEVAILRVALGLQVWAKVASGETTADRIASSHQWDPLGT